MNIAACSDPITDKFTRQTYADKLTSDHFPIFIKYGMADLYTTKSAKWKLEEANWSIYQNLIILPDQFFDHNEALKDITNKITLSATEAIPRTSTRVNNKYYCFWWTEQCSEAINAAGRQCRRLYRNHNTHNVTEYSRLDAIARRTLLDSKKNKLD